MRTDGEVALSAARAVSTGIRCAGCGAPLEVGRRHRRHCGGKCRAIASRRRNAENVAALLDDVERLVAALRPRR
jgi:hypothetical protein